MTQLDGSSPPPLAAIIAATVALDEALARQQYPQARHHARMAALRSDIQGLHDISEAAQTLMRVLNGAIRPSEAQWLASLTSLHRAIDRAFDPDAPLAE